eukprot:gene20212-biopygen6583
MSFRSGVNADQLDGCKAYMTGTAAESVGTIRPSNFESTRRTPSLRSEDGVLQLSVRSELSWCSLAGLRNGPRKGAISEACQSKYNSVHFLMNSCHERRVSIGHKHPPHGMSSSENGLCSNGVRA